MDRERPPKLPDVQAEVCRLLDAGWIVPVPHALMRLEERILTTEEIKHVLRHGRRDLRRDEYDDSRDAWRYVIEGKTLGQERKLRVVFRLGPEPPLPNPAVVVITVVDLGK